MVNTAALLWALGPKKTVVLGIQCSLACSAARFCVVLAGSTKKVHSPRQRLSFA